MARFDSLLVAPSPGQLAAELARATHHANEGQALLHLDRAQRDALVVEAGRHPEGLRQWSDSERGQTARVAVAWWTDHVGRKHFRIQAGNSSDGSYRTLTSTRTDPRPALWHVYPEQVFYRERGKERGWRVVCGCGLCDSPGRLAWMGTHCGPCHDRLQEGQTLPTARCRTLRQPEASLVGTIFSPDDRHIALARTFEVTGAVRWYNLAEGTWRDHDIPGRPTCLAVSPDGQVLAVAAQPGAWHGLLELSSGAWLVEHEGRQPARCLVFSPPGLALAVARQGGVEQWEQSGSGWLPVWERPIEATALAYSPGGDLLAAGGSAGLTLMEATSGQVLVQSTEPMPERSAVLALTFPARDRLLALTGPASRSWSWDISDPTSWPQSTTELHLGMRIPMYQLRLYEVGPGHLRLRHTVTTPAGERGALSADGRWLAYAVAQGNRRPLVAILTTTTGEEIGRVGWDLDETISGVTLSTDGQTLATRGAYGTVKIIPWKLLLDS